MEERTASVFRVESGERSTVHAGNIRWDYTTHEMWLSKSMGQSWVYMAFSWNDSHETWALSMTGGAASVTDRRLLIREVSGIYCRNVRHLQTQPQRTVSEENSNIHSQFTISETRNVQVSMNSYKKSSPLRHKGIQREGDTAALNLNIRWREMVNFKPRPLYPWYPLTHCGRVTQICVFNTVQLGTSASSP